MDHAGNAFIEFIGTKSFAGPFFEIGPHLVQHNADGVQARYVVELEIVLPQDMTVLASHDLSLSLQEKVCGTGLQ